MQQLAQAGTGLVQAVLQLQSPASPARTPDSDDAARLANDAIQRVAQSLHRTPARTNVLRNLGTMIVEADPQFLQQLLQQPEVASASPNKLAESPFIPPRGKRPV